MFICIMITTEFQSTKTFLPAAFEQLEICIKISASAKLREEIFKYYIQRYQTVNECKYTDDIYKHCLES